MKDNKYYFDYSIENIQVSFNFLKPSQNIFITKNGEDPTNIMKENSALIELIDNYKIAKEFNNNSIKIKILLDILNLLKNSKNIHYSPFCVYFSVVDYSFSSFLLDSKYKTEEEVLEILKNILEHYLIDRHEIYKSYEYSAMVLQVLSDFSSSKRRSNIGFTNMLLELGPLGFINATSLEEFLDKNLCYIMPDKGQKKIFDSLVETFDIKLRSKKDMQDKYPDLFVKVFDEYYIIEHKNVNNLGGSQDKSIFELISIIKNTETDNKINYISCLDGNYFTFLEHKSQKENKQVKQYNEIVQTLMKNKKNYFVNSKGLGKLMFDLKRSKTI